MQRGDRLFISRVAPLFNWLNHGDIVIYSYEERGGRRNDALMRIVGMPGDLITINGGDVFRNGVVVNETYLPPGTFTMPEMEQVRLRDGEYFLLIDNRHIGGDSRDFGVVAKRNITARAVVRFMGLR